MIDLFSVLVRPVFSEKSTNAVEKGKYIFRVRSSANKSQVKRAVEKAFGVTVRGVNIVKMPKKLKMFKGVKGIKSPYKKAYVTLSEGDSINLIKS